MVRPVVLSFVVVILLWASTGHAYIDPGVGNSLFQAVYALVFGTIMAWVLRPWTLFRMWWQKWRHPHTEHSESSSQPLSDKPE